MLIDAVQWHALLLPSGGFAGPAPPTQLAWGTLPGARDTALWMEVVPARLHILVPPVCLVVVVFCRVGWL